ncbi:MAG: tetratricopeptide repeat protein, partial [Terriglobales bacterium]
ASLIPGDGVPAPDPTEVDRRPDVVKHYFSKDTKVTRQELEMQRDYVLRATLNFSRRTKSKLPPELETEFRKLEKDIRDSRKLASVRDLNLLAVQYQADGKSKEAEKYLKEAIAVYDANPNEKPRDVQIEIASVLSNLSGINSNRGNFAEAEKLGRRAVELHEKLLGANDPGLGILLGNLGWCALQSGRYQEAHALYSRARKLLTEDESLRPALATIINNLGDTERALGNYTDSQRLLQEALDMRKKLLSPNHFHLAYSYACLGKLFRDVGVLTEAKANFERALEINDQTGDRIETAFILDDYARLMRKMNKQERADQLSARADAVRKRFKN